MTFSTPSAIGLPRFRPRSGLAARQIIAANVSKKPVADPLDNISVNDSLPLAGGPDPLLRALAFEPFSATSLTVGLPGSLVGCPALIRRIAFRASSRAWSIPWHLRSRPSSISVCRPDCALLRRRRSRPPTTLPAFSNSGQSVPGLGTYIAPPCAAALQSVCLLTRDVSALGTPLRHRGIPMTLLKPTRAVIDSA